MANQSLHPAARILVWVGWAVAAEAAAPSALTFMAVAAATAFLFAPVRSRLLQLLRRTRWLLAVLGLTYAYVLPGAPLWPELGWASPTAEGMQQGGLRVARLVLMLAGVAALLALTSRSRLIYGLYVLAKPLAVLGLDRRAFAVRLGLTLDYVERMPKPENWLDALRSPLPDDDAPASYSIEPERWHARDSAVILASLCLVGLVLG